MLCSSNKNNIVIFSLGKTGSTSVQEALTNHEDWQTLGESPNQYEQLAEFVQQGYEPVFIIREPYKRFVSGLRELIADYISVFDSFEQINFELYEEEKIFKFLERIVYLSRHPWSNEQAEKYGWGDGFSINANYHTRNWLIDVYKDYPTARYIDITKLNDLLIELGATPIQSNTSSEKEQDLVEKALKKLNNYQAFENYIKPEIEVYERICKRV